MASSSYVVLNTHIEHQPASAFRADSFPALTPDPMNVIWVCIGLILMAVGFAVSGIAELLKAVARPAVPGDLFQG